MMEDIIVTKQIISSDKAPSAIGPYSQAVRAGNLVFLSGQIPLDPGTGEVIYGDIKKATARCIENIKAIAEEAGCSLNDIIKTTIFIKDMNEFSQINEVYGTYFTQKQPARSCVQVAKLPKDADIEIEAIILKK
jgi:2-iminobutanoate/2-iminopropanoate deaminase